MGRLGNALPVLFCVNRDYDHAGAFQYKNIAACACKTIVSASKQNEIKYSYAEPAIEKYPQTSRLLP
jgi:hypothetical protein